MTWRVPLGAARAHLDRPGAVLAPCGVVIPRDARRARDADRRCAECTAEAIPSRTTRSDGPACRLARALTKGHVTPC